MDLKALKIAFYEIDEDKTAGWYYLGNYVCTYWDVILFSNDENFHFARRNYNGELYHKIGYFGYPKKCSEKDKYLDEYNLVKKYRLRYWQKIKN